MNSRGISRCSYWALFGPPRMRFPNDCDGWRSCTTGPYQYSISQCFPRTDGGIFPLHKIWLNTFVLICRDSNQICVEMIGHISTGLYRTDSRKPVYLSPGEDRATTIGYTRSFRRRFCSIPNLSRTCLPKKIKGSYHSWLRSSATIITMVKYCSSFLFYRYWKF